MKKPTFIDRAKHNRDCADIDTISALNQTIPEKITQAVNDRKPELTLSVDKNTLDILRMEKSPAKDLFYAYMDELGIPESAIRLHSYSEMPPYSYSIILTIGM